MNISHPEEVTPLTPHSFYLLLALAENQMMGFEIVKQIYEDSGGLLSLKSSTVYPALKRLLSTGLIESISEPTTYTDGRARRVYRLTSIGRLVLEWELTRYSHAATLGQDRLTAQAANAADIILARSR
jgi:PadR family transcriptional regulator PadR